MTTMDGVEITVLETRIRYFVRYPPQNSQGACSTLPAKSFVLSILSGRDGGIRTRDPLNPIQVRYQAAPRPDPGRKRRGLRLFAGEEACDLLQLHEGRRHPGVR